MVVIIHSFPISPSPTLDFKKKNRILFPSPPCGSYSTGSLSGGRGWVSDGPSFLGPRGSVTGGTARPARAGPGGE